MITFQIFLRKLKGEIIGKGKIILRFALGNIVVVLFKFVDEENPCNVLLNEACLKEGWIGEWEEGGRRLPAMTGRRNCSVETDSLVTDFILGTITI